MPFKDEELLKQIPLFKLLDNDEMHALALQLDEKRYLAGQMIFYAGEEGGAMYIVQKGRVEIFLLNTDNERVTLGYVEDGDLFGEFSLLDNEPRSASALAVENTDLVVVDQNDLHLLVRSHPAAALDMMAMLTKRIREANYRVQERGIRNINEEIAEKELTVGERFADFLTTAASNIYFAYFSFFWFAIWIVWNTGLIPGVVAFDPFPFGLLTMIVSLEAIFLSLFVLISQDRQAKRDRIRNDIEYETNIRAEVEIRTLANQVEMLQQVMLQHLADLKDLQTPRRRKPKPKQIAPPEHGKMEDV
jgi:CRP/FNR family transcriptional regulator, cyclic AMP receptor protein